MRENYVLWDNIQYFKCYYIYIQLFGLRLECLQNTIIQCFSLLKYSVYFNYKYYG